MLSKSTRTSIFTVICCSLFCFWPSSTKAKTFGPHLGPKLENCKVRKNTRKWQVETCLVAGSDFYATIGITEVNVPHKKVINLLQTAYTRCLYWMQNCVERKQLSRKGQRFIYYNALKLPWPLANRDVVVEAHYQRYAETTAIELLAIEGRYPKQEDRVRVKNLQGLWQITDLKNGRQKIRYVMHIEPAGNVPSALVNPFLAGMMEKAMTMLHYALGLSPSD